MYRDLRVRLRALRGCWILILLLSPSAADAQPPRTLRLDYYHTGTATSEVFALDRLVVEPAPWPGNPARPVDDTNLGKYLFEVIATVAADSAWAPYVFVHEFGHHFAALADEYYTSEVAYLPGAARVEPWEMNVTALHEPASLKWKDLVAPGTPLPTPWPKDAFEKHSHEIQTRRRAIRTANRPEAEVDALFREQQAEETRLLSSGPHAHAVGAFEGAMYEARGCYRPQADCIMFTRNQVPFCAVCRRALARVIDLYSR